MAAIGADMYQERTAEMHRVRIERYEWAKRVDPEAVAAFEASAQARHKKGLEVTSQRNDVMLSKLTLSPALKARVSSGTDHERVGPAS